MNYPVAHSKEELLELINNSDKCPDLAEDEVGRIIDLAERRAQLRQEDSAFDAEDHDCIITTDWTGFASGEFDYDNGHVNQFAMGVYQPKASAEKQADLFKSTVIVQNGWMQTGDGRRNKVKEYEDEDFEKSGPGDFWVPKGAQDYILIVALAPELVHGQPSVADAM